MSSASNGSRLARARARVYDAPHQEENRKRLEGLVEKALAITGDILETGEPSEQLEASRIVLKAWLTAIEQPAPLPGAGAAQTKEQWEAQAEAAFEDPTVREFLRRKGCILPPAGKEKN